MRLHDLRHTCASLAISAGANIKVVQKLLGYKSAVLTLDRYGHLFPDDLDAVAAAFDSAADGTADGQPAKSQSGFCEKPGLTRVAGAVAGAGFEPA